MYNFLLSLPIRVVIHNIGNIDSIGNAIFLAGNHRRACKHSTFMFHGVGVDAGSHARLELKNLREMLDSILADQQRIADILIERTKITRDEAGTLFAEARTKNANEALENGIVHEICDVAIPAGAPIFTLVFN
jgi:ATP-dependent protease ClpP protease subunit